MEQQQLLHVIHPEHPLVFNPDDRRGYHCWGCWELVYGPSYSFRESGCYHYGHHKSCAELPLGLHHPLHPIHPLILFPPWTYSRDGRQFYKCQLCKEYKDVYTYRCSRCNFNLHITCASLAPTTMKPDFHHHPLTPIWKWITFTCDLCGKKDEGTPYLCNPCGFWIHGRCSLFPCKVKVVHHKHLLHLTHSSLEFHQSDSRFCQICVQEVDTCYGLYYCCRCDFVAHLNCAMGNKENINLQEFKDEDEVSELNESVDSTYIVKKYDMREGGIQIAAEIKHFNHEHDLMLTEQLLKNQKCDGECLDPFEKLKCEAFDIFVNEVLCVGKVCPCSCVKRAPHAFSFASTRSAGVSSQGPRQLIVELYRLKQEPGQSIDDFFFHTCNICGIKFHYMNQHGLCMQCPIFCEYRDQLKKFSPLPSIEKVFKELVQEVMFTSFQGACTRGNVYKSYYLGLVTQSWPNHPLIRLQHLQFVRMSTMIALALIDLTLNMIILTFAPSVGFEAILLNTVESMPMSLNP